MKRRHLRALATLTGLVVLQLLPGLVAAPANAPQPSGTAGPGRVLAARASLPLAFIENRGQIDSRVRFYAQGPRYAFHFTRNAAVLSLTSRTAPDAGVVQDEAMHVHAERSGDGYRECAMTAARVQHQFPAQWRGRSPKEQGL